MSEIDRVIEAYEADPLSAPLPLEIVSCLDRLGWQSRLKGRNLKRWFERLEDLVSVSGHAESSSLFPYLDRLRALVQSERERQSSS